MGMKNYLPYFLFLFIFISCGTKTSKNSMKDLEKLYSGVPNPASIYCQELGYKTEFRTDSSGGQYEVCIFPDGSECGTWDFLKGKCGQRFSCCEMKGSKIKTEVKDMGTWKMEYAVCVLSDGSEFLEWEFFKERCKKKDR
jgi:putative hemolysin